MLLSVSNLPNPKNKQAFCQKYGLAVAFAERLKFSDFRKNVPVNFLRPYFRVNLNPFPPGIFIIAFFDNFEQIFFKLGQIFRFYLDSHRLGMTAIFFKLSAEARNRFDKIENINASS